MYVYRELTPISLTLELVPLKPDVKSFMGYNNPSGIIGVGPVIIGKGRWSLMSKAPIGRAEAMPAETRSAAYPPKTFLDPVEAAVVENRPQAWMVKGRKG